MLRIEIDDAAVQAWLAQAQMKLADMTPLFQGIGALLVSSTKLRFVDEVDPSGNKWLKLSDATLAHRRKEGKDAKILQDSGHLLGGIIYQPSPQQVLVGPSGPATAYAGRHQFGIGVPQRAFLGFTDADRLATIDLIKEYLTR
jgi:phage virion morphogenesis protein